MVNIIQKKEPVSISIRQYVDNPSGKGSGYLAARYVIKQGLNVTFINLLQKYRQQFYAIPYTYDNGDLLIHVKVPSEEYNINKITYDVIFKIFYKEDVKMSLRKVEMFSNSPAFLFTYAYVYYHSNLIIKSPDLASKLPSIALTQAPVIRNPIESLGYEKSTYIAARYLLDGFILNPSYIGRFGKRMNPIEEARLLSIIADPEALVRLYAHARDMQVKKHRKAVDFNRRSKREAEKQKYVQQQRSSKPVKSGTIIKRSPRSKITARKAKRSLMN